MTNGSAAGRSAPLGSGYGIHIKRYPGGYVLVRSPYLQFHTSSAILGEDPCAYLVVAPSTLVARNGGGIWATRAWDRVLGLPCFLDNTGPTLLELTQQRPQAVGARRSACTSAN